MGNELNLPNSHRAESVSETEVKNRINHEIDGISNQIDLINNQIGHLEYIIKQSKRSIEYYQTIIADITLQLQQTQMEQINAQLTYENYVEKTKRYVDSLKEFEEQNETDIDGYSDNEISKLQQNVSLLGSEIATNEEIMKEKTLNLLPNSC